MNPQLEDLLKLQAQRDLDSLWSYEPLPEQDAFFQSTSKIRIVRGGNRSSKTVCSAVEFARWVRGVQLNDTWRPIRKPRKGKLKMLAATVDYDHIADVLWKKLGKPGAYYKWRFDCPKCGELIFAVPDRKPVVLLPDEPNGKFDGYTGIVSCHNCDYSSDIDDLERPWLWEAPPLIPEQLIEKVAWNDKARGIPARIETEHAVISFKSGNSGRKHFQGDDNDIVWIDEELGVESEGVFDEILRGTIDRRGLIMWSATPLAKQPALIDLHDRARTGDGDVCEVVLGLAKNHHLSKKEREAVIRGWPKEQWACRVNGEFLILEGLVYGEFSREDHIIEAFNIDAKEYADSFTWYRAIDPGIGTTCVLWFAVDVFGNYIITDELYLHAASVQQMVKRIKEVDRNRHIVDTVIDPSDQRSVFCREGLRVVLRRDYGISCHSHFDRDIQQGIFRVKEDLVPQEDTGKPKMQVFDRCKNFIHEMSRYGRGETKGATDMSNKPVKKADHGPDSYRYRIMAGMSYRPPPSESAVPAGAWKSWKEEMERDRRKRQRSAGRMMI